MLVSYYIGKDGSMPNHEVTEALKDVFDRIEVDIRNAPAANNEEDNYDAGYLRGLWDAQEKVREAYALATGECSVSP